jgi:hypothetical protein
MGILGLLATILAGLYQLGPGMNKRQVGKKQKQWIQQWNDLFKNK